MPARDASMKYRLHEMHAGARKLAPLVAATALIASTLLGKRINDGARIAALEHETTNTYLAYLQIGETNEAARVRAQLIQQLEEFRAEDLRLIPEQRLIELKRFLVSEQVIAQHYCPRPAYGTELLRSLQIK